MQGSSFRTCAPGVLRPLSQLARFYPTRSGRRHGTWYAGCLMALAALVALANASQRANASTINYGNFGPVPPGITFLSVTESSVTDPVPMFGPPTPFVTGLDFDPTNFVAFATGGGSDVTDGQLNFSIKSNGPAIGSVTLFERGDYTLAGVGSSLTSTFAGAVILASITEIGGVPVVPIPLPPVNASVGFNLLANPGVVQPWSLGITLAIPANVGVVTKLDVVIDNQLLAISEASSAAFIAKKDFVISTGPIIPEPVTLVMLLMGLPLALRKSRGS